MHINDIRPVKSIGLKNLAVITFLFVMTLPVTLAARQDKGSQAKTLQQDSILLKSLVTMYALSINRADTGLASGLWAHTGEISFIHPGGNEYGWNNIKKIYKMFGDNFTSRKLSFFNLKIADYKDFAWLQFNWIFDGLMKPDNTPVQTNGRETQIWRKINNEWRLVHVHYSDIPVTGIGQGF